MSSLTKLVASQRFGFHRSNVEVKEAMQETWSTNEFTARFACLKAWFVRASWYVKLGFLVDVISILGDDMCARLMRYVGLSRFKDFNYLKSQDIPGPRRDVPLRDSSRCLNLAILEDIQQLDKAWIVTLKESQQLNLVNVLVNLGGCALKRKVYEVLLHRMDHSRKVTAILDNIPPNLCSEDGAGGSGVRDTESGDGGGQRARADTVTLDEEWTETFRGIRDQYFRHMSHVEEGDDDEKRHRQSLFFKDPFVVFKDDQLQKLQKEISSTVDPKENGEKMEFEYIQFLPEPINLMIFSYLDKDTLKVTKQVSPYWAFITDQVEKERAARAKCHSLLLKLSSSTGEKKAKPEKKGKKKMPPPPPPPVEIVVVPPEVDPRAKEKVVLLLKLFKPPTCKSFFSKNPISRSLRDEFFTFRVMCCDSTGQKLAVSTVRCSVDFYSLQTGEAMPEMASCTSHVDFITCMCFLPKGTHLVTGSADTTVRYLKVSKKSSEEVRILEHDKGVTAVCCSNKYVVSGSSDACVKVFNLGKRECECVIENSVEVTALEIDPDSVAIYVGFKSGVIKVIKIPESLLQMEINNTHVNEVSVLHLVYPILLSGGGDGVVRAWDVSGDNFQYCLAALGEGSKDNSYSPVVALCSEENYVLSGDGKGFVRIWNLVTGKLVKELQVCGLSQAVAGIHVNRKADVVEVFACTLSVLKLLTFERKQEHKHGMYGPAHRTCCTVYADPEEAKEKPYGTFKIEYEEKKLERRSCVEQKLKETLAPPMLSSSVLIAAIKKRPDVFIEPARNMVMYGRESFVNI